MDEFRKIQPCMGWKEQGYLFGGRWGGIPTLFPKGPHKGSHHNIQEQFSWQFIPSWHSGLTLVGVEGLRFSIKGGEVALHGLRIHMRIVVSTKLGKAGRRILKDWWDLTQTSTLIEILTWNLSVMIKLWHSLVILTSLTWRLGANHVATLPE